MNSKRQQMNHRERRRQRIRAKILGTLERPRLSVFRSNRYISAQLIDDTARRTLAAVSTRGITGMKPLVAAGEIGKKIAAEAKTKKISRAVFDRGGYLYTGKVKAVAEGARSGGLEF